MEVIPGYLFIAYGYAVPVVIFAALYGLRWNEGLWSNLISIGCVWFAALTAVGWWEDLSYLFTLRVPSWMFFSDCLFFWLIFLLALIVLDSLCREFTKVKVYYNETIEKAGNGVALFILGVSLYGVFLFAEDLSAVGDHVDTQHITTAAPENIPKQPDADAPEEDKVQTPFKPTYPKDTDPRVQDTFTVQMLRILSAGNLSGFIAGHQFDTHQEFRRDQLMRRIAVMYFAEHPDEKRPEQPAKQKKRTN